MTDRPAVKMCRKRSEELHLISCTPWKVQLTEAELHRNTLEKSNVAT